MRKMVGLGLAFILAVMPLSACSMETGKTAEQSGAQVTEQKSGQTENKDFKIAMIAAGVFGDQGMNDALKHGMEMFTERTGIQVNSVEISEFSDHAINARNFAQQGYDLILMGGPVSEIIPEIAAEYPDTHFLLNKGTVADMENVTSVQFDEADGGFLGGAFAVLMSQHLNGGSKVGWIGGERIPDLEKARYAFSAAASYMGGECDVVYVGSFKDIAKGKEIALQLYNEGLSVVQAYAGGASTGIYQAAESRPEGNYAMGCATGQFNLSPQKIIASSVVRYDDFFAELLEQYVRDGSLASGTVVADLKSGGVGIKYSPEIGDQIPEEIRTKLQEVENKIRNGELTVPTTEEEYKAFVGNLE